MNKTLRITCKGAATLDLDKLEPFQGTLKELSKTNYAKLRKSIGEVGATNMGRGFGPSPF